VMHQPYLDLLAIRDDLDPGEEAGLAAHLEHCGQCAGTAEIYALQDHLLRDATRVPTPEALERLVLDRVRTPRGHHFYPKAWAFGLAAVALLCVVVFAMLPLINLHSATPVSAYALLRRATLASPAGYPYTGSARVSYVTLPVYDLPKASATHIGLHRAIVHWSVRDQCNYRVEIRTLQPALDAGTTTVVVNGRKVLAYDTRTETAGQGTIPRTRVFHLGKCLLPLVLSGLVYGGPQPDPAQSIQSYLAQLRSGRASIGGGYVRIVGHTHMLGYPVDVLDFGPIGVDCTRSVSRRGHMPRCVSGHGKGWGRVWIDHDRPFILRYEEHGFKDVHDLGTQRLNFRYRVTALRFGQGPTDADLHYHPPVSVTQTGTKWTILTSDFASGGGITAPFISVGSPLNVSSIYWVLDPQASSSFIMQGPKRQPVALYSLFYAGKHITTYVTGADVARHPFGLYATGPYVLITERIRVHGLPRSLQMGTPQPAGSCTTWVGMYTDSQHWIAFDVRNVSFLIVSDTLDSRQLHRYVAKDICNRPSH
jgi:hypothetical protein